MKNWFLRIFYPIFQDLCHFIQSVKKHHFYPTIVSVSMGSSTPVGSPALLFTCNWFELFAYSLSRYTFINFEALNYLDVGKYSNSSHCRNFDRRGWIRTAKEQHNLGLRQHCLAGHHPKAFLWMVWMVSYHSPSAKFLPQLGHSLQANTNDHLVKKSFCKTMCWWNNWIIE